jgi:orotate phosphoribosyltransferase
VLSCRNVFAEREQGAAPGGFALRRGFDIREGERVLLAEDVVTTGGSVSELLPMVESARGVAVGIAAIADRSRGRFSPSVPLFALTTLDFDTWREGEVPERVRSIPAVKPGSRSGVGGRRG